jgi:hypothetical protein
MVRRLPLDNCGDSISRGLGPWLMVWLGRALGWNLRPGSEGEQGMLGGQDTTVHDDRHDPLFSRPQGGGCRLGPVGEYNH